ncbi:MAG: hypothetical protein A3J52_00630 [Omnitrophica bacterium RIFCSPHIGHO2_02_FULL_49_9]|nr:MAG: hypothetical protein A3J52_00630 [Omnitrophica bacterium RIFCSPHIGHO2_02_FULL_49_9]
MEIEPPDQEQPKPSSSETPKGKFLQNAFIRVQDFLFDPANFKKLIIGVVVLISIFVVRRIFFPPSPDLSKTKSAEESEKSDLVPVKVFKVGRFNFEDSLNALGTIKGLVEFKLSFEIPGVVSAINYREGEYYEEGALLISLKQDDILLRLQRSQAQDQKALAALKITQDKLEEHQKLFKMGAIPKSTLDRAALEMDQARFEHESAELETKANESILEKSNLYAPTAGTIGELNIEEGEAVTQNTLVGSHVRTDRVLATFGITERDINKVSLGQKANVFVDAYPERTFEGIVENVAPVIIGTSRTADVRVRIENPEGILLPGMFARIKILLYQKRNTLVVPTDALLGKENEQHVFVVDPEEKGVTQTPVVVGYSRVDYVQIDSGINEGDLVVVSGMDRLKEDSKVRILETQEAEL